MNNKTFNFAAQIGVGNKGEANFCEYYKDLEPIKSKEDLKYDFKLKDGRTVELKSDSYSMTKTPNFFFETISDTRSGKLGGPIRAFTDGIDLFVYYFINDKTFFWFDTDSLFKKVDEYILTKKPEIKTIKNRNWLTQGYACERDFFNSVLLKKDIFN